MKLKDLFSWGQKTLAAPFVSFIGQNTFENWLGQTTAHKKYLEEYRNWVFACVQARAEAVSSIQLELYKGDKEITENGHEILDLLYKVNPTMTKEDLFMGTQAYLDLDGNAYWFLARENEGKGKIREIWLLRPDKMNFAVQKENPLQVAGYLYTQPDGKRIPFEPKEILHFKNFNPTANFPFPHKGMGVVQACQWAIETDNEARNWNYSFFKNSAKPEGFLVKEGTGTISTDEYQRIKKMWTQEHQGSGNAYKPAILAGGLKWQDLTRSQKDMDFIEQRRFSRDEILAIFRTPKTVLGIVEDVNRANAEASNYVFASRTVDPLMKKIIGTLNEFLLPEFGEDLYLDYESPIPADRTALIAEYTAGIDKWLTRNDIRTAEGLTPSENGNQIFGTLASVPIDEVKQPIKMARPVAKRYKRKSETAKMVDDFISKLPKKENDKEENKQQLSETAIKNYTEIWKKQFDIETEPLKKKLNLFLADQEKEVIANVIEETKGLEEKEFKFKAIDDYLYNEQGAINTAIKLITPNIKRYIKTAGEQAILLTGIDAAFDFSNPRVQKFIDQRAEYFAKTFNETTTEKLRKEIQAGLEENETTAQLSERVAKFYDGERNYRSERAARTEVSASSNFAAEEAYKQAGVKQMQWLVVEPQDEDCLANEGEIRKIGEEFSSGDTAPPVHPNCVCTLLPYFG